MSAADERLLSLDDVADRLQVSDQSVRRWIKAGKLAAYKPGLEWRIKPSDLEEFLENRSYPKVQAPLPDAGQERRAPTVADLNAVEQLADFCRQLAEFLDVAERTNMDENLWQMQYAMTRYMAAMTLPYLERADVKSLFLGPAARHVELYHRLEDSAKRSGIALGVSDTEDTGADVIDLMAQRVERRAS